MAIELQLITSEQNIPTEAEFKHWVDEALEYLHNQAGEICIRLVDEAEITNLNEKYRKKSGATNILSFPFKAPHAENFLGDIVICVQVVNREPLTWAHITIHGVLHLLGYDHINDNDAKEMEKLETIILHKLGIESPYEESYE